MRSKRGYLTIAELQSFANITVTDEAEAWDQITEAEELIDAYVGHQEKSFQATVDGEVTSVSGATIFDTDSRTPLDVTNNSYQGCAFEIVAGTGAGQIGRIVSSNRSAKSITLAEAFADPPDTTSVYKIYQLAKFPRAKDYTVSRDGDTVYKTVPDVIRRATAAQVAFMIEKGAAYFNGDNAELSAERILNYSYQRGTGSDGQSAAVKYIAPRARTLLRGIKNRLGRITVGE